MKNMFNSIQYISKYSILIAAALIAVFATAAVMAADVRLQSDINVKNVTDGATTYTESTDADNKDIVRFKVWYHVLELSNSGLVADNVTVTVGFPSELGKTHTVTSTAKGDNTNTVTDTATVTAPSETSSLTFIPGSAKWQHNVGDRVNINYEMTQLDDSAITEGKPIAIGDVLPSYEYEGWIYFDAVVKEEKKPQEPVYKCKSLTAAQDGANKFKFTFTTKKEMSDDVTVNKYVYDFGTSENKVSTDNAQVTKIYEKPGSYDVAVEVIFNVGEGQESDVCTTNVKIVEEPKEPPVEPPKEIPNTGPVSVIAGLFGTGALGYGAVSFSTSRSELRDSILGKKED